VVLPPELFVDDNTAIRVFNIDSIFGELDQMVAITQDQYSPLMKAWQREHAITTVFSVAPESSSAVVSALLCKEWMYDQIIIDFRADIYTFV